MINGRHQYGSSRMTSSSGWWLPHPFTVALAGPLAEPFKVTWDSDLTMIDEARKRYQGTPGFAGIIMGKSTLGIRISDKVFDAAMQYLGKPLGDQFEVRGVPLGATEDVIEDLLLQAGWQAQLISGFRRSGQGLCYLQSPLCA